MQPIETKTDVAPKWVERRAKLFEAGDYPDKGVSVTPEHLLRIAESFDRPVPLLIEHASSPLQLGYLTQVEANGNELFGTLSLSDEANRLVERSGARALSLGLAPDLSYIREVSLVQNPRVPTAQIFGGGPVFESSLPDLDAAYWRERFEALERNTRESGAEQIVQGFLRQGKLVPAQVPFARAILASDDTLEFDGSRQPLRQLLIAILERQPPHRLFDPPTPSPESEAALLLPEEASFYRRHFPDLSLKDIAGAR